MGYNLRTIVFCPRCFIDVEEDIGYLEWKHYKYCPNDGTELVHVPIEYRPEEYKIYVERGLEEHEIEQRERMYVITGNPEWIKARPGLFKDTKTIFERLDKLRESENAGKNKSTDGREK